MKSRAGTHEIKKIIGRTQRNVDERTTTQRNTVTRGKTELKTHGTQRKVKQHRSNTKEHSDTHVQKGTSKELKDTKHKAVEGKQRNIKVIKTKKGTNRDMQKGKLL